MAEPLDWSEVLLWRRFALNYEPVASSAPLREERLPGCARGNSFSGYVPGLCNAWSRLGA